MESSGASNTSCCHLPQNDTTAHPIPVLAPVGALPAIRDAADGVAFSQADTGIIATAATSAVTFRTADSGYAAAPLLPVVCRLLSAFVLGGPLSFASVPRPPDVAHRHVCGGFISSLSAVHRHMLTGHTLRTGDALLLLPSYHTCHTLPYMATNVGAKPFRRGSSHHHRFSVGRPFPDGPPVLAPRTCGGAQADPSPSDLLRAVEGWLFIKTKRQARRVQPNIHFGMSQC